MLPDKLDLSHAFVADGLSPPCFRVRLSCLHQLLDHPIAFAPDTSRRPDGPFKPIMQSIRQHFAESTEDQGDGLVCAEAPLPKGIVACIEASIPSPDGFAGRLHAGRTRSCGPLHYDWDHQWVVQVCLSGVKRFVFFPPSAGWLLAPRGNHAALDPVRLESFDRQELLLKLGGTECRLSAGEAVIFPSIWWHGVLYEEAGVALSLRFGRPVAMRPWCVFPPDWRLQRLVAMMLEQPIDLASMARWIRALHSAVFDLKDEGKRIETVVECLSRLLSEANLRHGARFWKALKYEDAIQIANVPTQQSTSSQNRAKLAEWLGAAFKSRIPRKQWESVFFALADAAAATRRGLPGSFDFQPVLPLID